MKTKLGMFLGVVFIALLSISQVQAAPPAGLSEKVAALKTALQQNQAQLKQYQWVETVTVSKGGDVKSQKQYNCYYGVDGTLQKILIDSSSSDQGGGRRFGLMARIKANKKEEMADYMQSAMALIKKYIPPQASLIQAAMAANNVSIKPEMATQGMGLNIQNYLMPGDSLDIGLNTTPPQVTSLSVNTYLDDPKDAVTLQVTFANLPDGTSYPQQTLMTAVKKGITVLTENSGYRKM